MVAALELRFDADGRLESARLSRSVSTPPVLFARPAGFRTPPPLDREVWREEVEVFAFASETSAAAEVAGVAAAGVALAVAGDAAEYVTFRLVAESERPYEPPCLSSLYW